MYQHPGGDAVAPPDLDQLIGCATTLLIVAGRALQFGLQKAVRARPVDRGVDRGKAERQKFLELDA